MTTPIDITSTDRSALKVWEAVRTVASVVIAMALLTIAAGSTLFESTHVPDQTLRPTSLPAHVPLSSPNEPPQPVTDVFFLVRTSEEAYLADLGARERLSEASYRHYEVLYARDDEELKLAGESILDYILASDTTRSVQVIDLRGVKTAGQDN
jgi:hypothetical protein